MKWILVLLAVLPVSAQAMTTERLVRLCGTPDGMAIATCFGYFEGYMDGMKARGDPCVPPDPKLGRIVKAYMATFQKWHGQAPARLSVGSFLYKHYKCSTEKPR